MYVEYIAKNEPKKIRAKKRNEFNSCGSWWIEREDTDLCVISTRSYCFDG